MQNTHITIVGLGYVGLPLAVEFAKKTANRFNGEVVIHKRTGEIENRVSLAK